MEKFLRLLNPKSINYEADRIDGGAPQLTTQDVLLALSFAGLSDLENLLVEMLVLKQFSINQTKEISFVIQKQFVRLEHAQDMEEHSLAIYVSLIEIFHCPANYKASERKRSVIAGVSRMKIQRSIGKLIDEYKNKILHVLNIATNKINEQIKLFES